jgi:hypothetical protein
MDRVTGGEAPISGRPGELAPPEVEVVRKEQGPFRSDEDLLLAILFMPKFLRELKAAGPTRTIHPLSFSPIVDIVREAASRPGIRRLDLLVPDA